MSGVQAVSNGNGFGIGIYTTDGPASVCSYGNNAINQNTNNFVGTLGTKPLQ